MGLEITTTASDFQSVGSLVRIQRVAKEIADIPAAPVMEKRHLEGIAEAKSTGVYNKSRLWRLLTIRPAEESRCTDGCITADDECRPRL